MPLLKWAEQQGEFSFSSSSADEESDPEAGRILEFLGTDCLMAAPLMVGGTTMGFLGLRNVDEEARRQLKQTRQMEVQREIIEGLSSEYYSVLLVNPRTDVVTTYRAEVEEGRAIQAYFRRYDNCWSKGILAYSKEMITEASRREFLEKLSLRHIQEDGEDYSFTYEKLTEGGIIYLQARISFVHEKDGGLVAVVGTRNVDDLIKKERRQEMALQAAFDAA